MAECQGAGDPGLIAPRPAGSLIPATTTPSQPATDMTAYSATIAATLSIAADRARLVVGYLRSEYRTLDSLSSQQIRADYREWIDATIDADPAMADQLAASYGL